MFHDLALQNNVDVCRYRKKIVQSRCLDDFVKKLYLENLLELQKLKCNPTNKLPKFAPFFCFVPTVPTRVS